MSDLLSCFRKKEKPVEYWDCSRLGLTLLPKEVFKHRATITNLNMNGNYIKDVPRAVFMFDVLEELDLSENDILFLPPSISQLSRLTSLNIRSNSLSNIPDEIEMCQNLILLDLSSNPLGRLCNGILELRQLRTLLVNDCSLEEVPPNIGKLSKLETLEARENVLRSLPSSMCNMTLLEKLDLGVNDIQILPPVVGSLESLSELWLDSNTLSSLPDEIGKLSHLKFLELAENQLMLLPTTLDGLTKLTDLYLNENLLTFLPETIGSLPNLVILRLDNNRLGSLPDTIDGWTNLTELSVGHNHLTDLPCTIGGLKNLISLNLDENLMSELPPEIGNCVALKLLSIRNNELSEIPSELAQIEGLCILNVVGNKLLRLPYSITRFKNLSAFWISENQTRPIMDLQMKRDEQGERWLTCYLIPQRSRESATSDNSSISSSDQQEKPAKLVAQRSSVAFDPKVEEKKSKLNRDLTPYPKELHLKAMQWRAARDMATGPNERQNAGDVQLRSPNRRLINRPYSLLKALSEPLDESLRPVGGDRVTSPISPTFSPILESEAATSPEAGVSSRPHTHVKRLRSNEAGRSRSQSPPSSSSGSVPPSSPPPILPPPTFDASVLDTSHVPADASLIVPPEEFSGHTPVRIQPNGGVRFQPQDLDKQETETSLSADVEHDQVALLVAGNSNGNNDHDRSVHHGNAIGLDEKGYINTGNQARQLYLLELQRKQQQQQQQPTGAKDYYPSDVSHSDIPDPEPRYSSMESGFDADNELESSAWYLSPDSSPKHSRRRRLSDQQQQILLASSTRPQNPSQSDSDGYDHLPAHTNMGASVAMSKPRPQVPRASGGTKDAYSVTIPRTTYSHSSSKATAVHIHSHHAKGARSFDATEVMKVSTPQNLPPSSPSPISPPPSFHPPPSHSHSHQKHTSYTMSARKGNHSRSFSQPEQLAHLIEEGRPGAGGPTRPRIFSDSGPTSQPPNHPSSVHTSRSLHTSPAYPRSRNTHDREVADPRIYPLLQRKPEHVMSDEVISAYPGHHRHRAAGTKGAGPLGRARHFSTEGGPSKERGGRGQERSSSRRHHQSENVGRADQYFVGDGSQESGQSMPEGVTMAAVKSSWVSGHDSGFDSMNRPNHPLSVKRGSDSTSASFVSNYSGAVVEVELTKDPTLGMGITGGRDGENDVKPGDTGFYVYRLAEGKPAERSGKLAVGDKLLEVNGIDISSLTLQEVSALLTGPEKQVTLLLLKEPMVTLL